MDSRDEEVGVNPVLGGTANAGLEQKGTRTENPEKSQICLHANTSFEDLGKG